MRLSKHHVFGNDFLVRIDDEESAAIDWTPGWVRGLCDRNRGVGADGVIRVRTDDAPAAAGEALRVAMRLNNADGGEAEVSGNGLACLAQALTLRAGRDAAEVVVATAAGERRVLIDGSRFADADDSAGGFGRIRSRATVDLGTAAGDEAEGTRAAAALGDAAGSRTGFVSVGNPHVVALVTGEDGLETVLCGEALQQDFGPVNFEVVAVQSRDRVRMRVWERGVGITAACGSGAAAATWQLHRWGLVDGTVAVETTGGTAEVQVGDRLAMRVPVLYVAEVEAPVPPRPCEGGDNP